jgi:hypothetical protein
MPGMHIRILDLDGGVLAQDRLVARWQPQVWAARDWGPHIRLACSHRRFCRFEQALIALSGSETDPAGRLTFIGSGDFHHVSLALVRRLATPFNLLVLDNHPDWMRGVPLLHCGTWLYHAARLPHVGRVFHAGGDVDFDNYYRPLAPWPELRSRKIVTFPAVRSFSRGRWKDIPNRPLRPRPDARLTRERAEELLEPFRDELRRVPLYISLDKDVLVARDAAVNWDSGHLELSEVHTLLERFLEAAGGNLIGMDVVGDWSPVTVRGWIRWFFHATEHPRLAVNPPAAQRCNERTNLTLLETVSACLRAARLEPQTRPA